MCRSDENKEKYQLGDYKLIQYQIVIMRIVKQTVRIITIRSWEVKGLFKQTVKIITFSHLKL